MSYVNGPRIVTDGLVLCLDAGNSKSYPGTGTTWTDLSGNGNNGTLVNGVAYNSSNGGSLVFDGTNDYITLSNINTNINNTFCFWFKCSVINRISTLIAGSGTGHYQIRINASNNIQLVKSFTADMGSFSGFSVANNTTYNVILSRLDNTYYLYVNGVFINTLTSSQTFTTSAPAIGYNANTGSSQQIEFFPGSIFNVVGYNKTLSANEVQQNYNALKGRFGL